MNNFIWKANASSSKININPTPNQEYETEITINDKKVFYQFIQQSKRISGTSQVVTNGIGRIINQDICFYSSLDNIRYFLPYVHTNNAVVYLKLENNQLRILANGSFTGNYMIEGFIFYTK